MEAYGFHTVRQQISVVLLFVTPPVCLLSRTYLLDVL